jgi:hypothetical protein
MVMTVVVMSGAVVAPTNAAAQAGDLIKMDGLSAVYYLGDDGQRYVFPNESTYFSWYSDFSGVVTVPSSELQSYPIGGNVTMRPGTNLVKITTDPTVYAVEPGGELRSIVSEDNAKDLYGDNWASRVVDVPDAFFVNYEQGSALTVGEYPTGTLVQEEGSSDVYFVDNGDYRAFSGEAAFLANNFKFSDVITTSETITANGSEITGFDTELFNPAGGATTGSGSVATGTGLSAALSASTPAAQSIPYNVQGQVYTSVNLTASNDGAVELTGLEVKRTGLGYYNSFNKVYVEVDGVRHGNKRTLGSDNIANLYFNTEDSKIIIPAGETITLDIVADMVTTTNEYASGDNALSIVSASAIDASATVSGSFPITGNLMSISSVEAPTAEFTLSKDTGDVYLGDEQIEVAEFELYNTSLNEDISFSEVTLENVASADPNEVINYTLYNDSDEIISGPVDADSNDMIKFVLDDAIVLEDGDKEDFVVKADIYDGRGETVALKLDESTDVKAVGLNNSFNVFVEDKSGLGTTIFNGDAGEYGYFINGGDLSFSEANTNPGDVDVAPKDEDVLFLAADVEALEEMITVTSMDFTLTAGGSATSLEDVTLYLDGNVVAGPIDVDTEYPTSLVFDEEFQVSGTQLLEVKADIANEAKSGTYIIDLGLNKVTAEDSDGDNVVEDNIKGSVDGGTILVASGSVDLYADATYGGRTLVAGDDLLVGQYIIEAGDAEGVKIDKYIVGFNTEIASHVALSNIEELYISEDDDIETSVSDNTDFNVTQELAAGENKVVKVYISLDSDLDVSSFNTIVTTLDVEGEGLISSEPLDDNKQTGQTIILGSGTLNTVISAGTPDSDIVVGGTADVEVAEWEFESENTSYTLKDIKVTVYADDGMSTTSPSLVTSMKLNGESATVVNGTATFNGPFEIAKNDDLKLNLLATFNGDFESVITGSTANFAITEYKKKAGNENTYTTSVGDGSGDDDYTLEDLDTEELMYVRNTVPTITASAGSTGTLKSSENEIMTVSVTADNADDVTIEALGLNIYSDVGTTSDDITINVLDSSGDIAGTATSTYASYVSGTDVAVTLDEVISAGQTEIYTVSVDYDSSTPLEDQLLRVKLVKNGFSWSDNEAENITVEEEAAIIIPATGVTFELTK